MKKKLFVNSAAAATALALMLTACGQTTTPASSSGTTPEDDSGTTSITDGIYEETTIGLKTFFRFNEDGTYYGFFFSGGVIEAGTYEVVDKEFEYRAETGADGEWNTDDDVMATASQVIVMTTYQGSVNEVAYVDDTILDATLGGMSNNRTLTHNATYEYVAADEEQSIAIYTFYANNETGSSLTLYHDKTFVDYTGDVGVEGTWEKTSDTVFTLTTEDGETITLTIDGSSAAYGDVTLSDTIVAEGEATVINTYRVDEAEVGLPMTVGLRIDCYSDSTCKLIVEVAAISAELEADTGTYELDEMLYTPTFHFEKGGDIVSEPDYASATTSSIDATVAYKADVEVEFSGTLTPLSIDATLTGTASSNAVPTGSANALANTFSVSGIEVGLPMTVDMRIECYTDGTCKAIVYVAQVDSDLVADTGTYEVAEVYKYSFHFEKAGDIEGEADFGTATASSVEVNVNYKADVEVEFSGTQTPLTIDTTLNGVASLS